MINIGGAYPHPDDRVRDFFLRQTASPTKTEAAPWYSAFLVSLLRKVASIVGTWSTFPDQAALAEAWKDYLEQVVYDDITHRDILYDEAVTHADEVRQAMLAEVSSIQASQMFVRRSSLSLNTLYRRPRTVRLLQVPACQQKGNPVRWDLFAIFFHRGVTSSRTSHRLVDPEGKSRQQAPIKSWRMYCYAT
jgi:hypothetical protein